MLLLNENISRQTIQDKSLKGLFKIFLIYFICCFF